MQTGEIATRVSNIKFEITDIKQAWLNVEKKIISEAYVPLFSDRVYDHPALKSGFNVLDIWQCLNFNIRH